MSMIDEPTPPTMHDPGPQPAKPSANLNDPATGTRKDFSTDGAFGGGSSPGGGAVTSGTSASDQYAAQQNANKPPMTKTTLPMNGGSQTFYNNAPTFGNANDLGNWEKSQGIYSPFDVATFDMGGGQANLYGNGLSFADGGAVPYGDDDEGMGNPQQAAIQEALNTVGGVLEFGYKLHGLDQGGQQTAANMPTVPASQSSTGQSPVPGPGTLAPADNPFGKRTVRPPLQMSQNTGAIDTSDDGDEDDTEQA